MKLFLHLACWRQVWNGETKSITELSDGDRLYNPRYHLISSAAPRHTLKQQHGWKFRHKLAASVCAARQVNTIEQYCIMLYYILARACLVHTMGDGHLLSCCPSAHSHSDEDMMAERINSILNEPKCVPRMDCFILPHQTTDGFSSSSDINF